MIRLLEQHNLDALLALRDAGESFHLAYLDPPFLSGRDYFTRDGELAFRDQWSDPEDYYSSVGAICEIASGLLTDDGCLVLHVDPKTSYRHKRQLDDIFGSKCFASEIIWRYRRWPSKQRNFQRVHDVLLRYVKNPDVEPRWTQLYEPLAESTAKTWGGKKRQRARWRADGKRDSGGVGDDPSPGCALGDVWDISVIAPVANERTGYPTQKPEALLRRLVLSLTYPGDRVLDPYCGSGTTLAVCRDHGRDAVGIDQSPVAIRMARERIGDGPLFADQNLGRLSPNSPETEGAA